MEQNTCPPLSQKQGGEEITTRCKSCQEKMEDANRPRTWDEIRESEPLPIAPLYLNDRERYEQAKERKGIRSQSKLFKDILGAPNKDLPDLTAFTPANTESQDFRNVFFDIAEDIAEDIRATFFWSSDVKGSLLNVLWNEFERQRSSSRRRHGVAKKFRKSERNQPGYHRDAEVAAGALEYVQEKTGSVPSSHTGRRSGRHSRPAAPVPAAPPVQNNRKPFRNAGAGPPASDPGSARLLYETYEVTVLAGQAPPGFKASDAGQAFEPDTPQDPGHNQPGSSSSDPQCSRSRSQSHRGHQQQPVSVGQYSRSKSQGRPDKASPQRGPAPVYANTTHPTAHGRAAAIASKMASFGAPLGRGTYMYDPTTKQDRPAADVLAGGDRKVVFDNRDYREVEKELAEKERFEREKRRVARAPTPLEMPPLEGDDWAEN